MTEGAPAAVRLIVEDAPQQATAGATWAWAVLAAIVTALIVGAWFAARRREWARRDPSELAFRRLCRRLGVGRAEAARLRAAAAERPGTEPVGLLLTGLADG